MSDLIVICLGKIDRQLFEYTVNTLNNLYAEAEKASCSTYCEGRITSLEKILHGITAIRF